MKKIFAIILSLVLILSLAACAAAPAATEPAATEPAVSNPTLENPATEPAPEGGSEGATP